ncbi:MAG: acetylxylan esterase [Candidatus Hydrogenedentes bacterium]|nr:acetylxylan esterase [Candidatus Hydrogenedentota bacterium]
MRTAPIALLLALTFTSLNTSADPVAARAALRAALGEAVLTAPGIHPAPEMDQGPIKAIYYDALPYENNPTRVFAYLGVPAAPEGQKLPAMVLVHGGGGTAFHDWVKIWHDKGYAAISMDLEGQLPTEGHPRHALGGPSRTGMFDDEAKPRNAQWMYHAVADIMLAHSLLRSLPEVDPARIGMTGISWGGVLSSLVAGVDDRFAFAAPVYGCGYLYDSKGYFNRMGAKDDATLELRKYWDPARYFTNAPMPMLWVNGDNDPHFSVDTMSRSHQSAGPASILSIHPRMPHGHGVSWETNMVPEIYALADHLLKGSGAPLARITKQPEAQKGATVILHYESKAPVVSASLYALTAPLEYDQKDEKSHLDLVQPFEATEALLDSAAKTVTATLPENCTWYYINLTDDRGCIVSSDLQSTAKPGK